MKRIIASRYGGKTTRLINMAKETGGYIVCAKPHEVADQARRMGVDIMFPLSYSEFINNRYYGKNIKGFLFDNVEDLLHEMSGPVRVFAMSASTDNEP
jgi:hypothetical protein